MAYQTPYHDSDADDEYERSAVTSPRIEDSDASPTDSEAPSTEITPTTFENSGEDRISPKTIITEWSTDECADFLTSLGFGQYRKLFIGMLLSFVLFVRTLICREKLVTN